MEPKACVPSIDGWNFPYLQERYIFRTHHDIAHHDIGNPPATPTMKGIPLWPVGKGRSGCVPKVCWNNLRLSLSMPGRDLGKLSFLFLNLNLWGIWGDTNPWSEKRKKNIFLGWHQHPVGFVNELRWNLPRMYVYIYIYVVYLPTMKGWFLWEQKTNNLGGGFNPSETY